MRPQKEPLHLPSVLELWKSSGKTIRIVIQGSSMSPFIKMGESVSLRLTGSGELRRGDILAFREGNHIVVHRFLKSKKEHGRKLVCQKGDGLSGWRWIPEERVLGKVESVQGRRGTRAMDRLPWLAFNRLAGLAWFLRVTLTEKLKAGSGRF